ncbi:MAG TPA: hypothetical protein VMS31_10050, partial [Pyrinomonadaceae bacterium]|nr:hypothetical protein [Pyrinomonadaceae bacterium]
MNTRLKTVLILLVALCVVSSDNAIAQRKTKPTSVYYPAPGNAWQHKRPEAVGMDSVLLDQAVAFANTHA